MVALLAAMVPARKQLPAYEVTFVQRTRASLELLNRARRRAPLSSTLARRRSERRKRTAHAVAPVPTARAESRARPVA